MALWAGWFTSAEQRARSHFAQGDYDAAAAQFGDAYRRGVALYRAARYRAAAQAFASVQRAEVRLAARYNLGNAWFQLKAYGRAVDAYQAVLDEDPDHRDAAHNLALAKRLLRQHRLPRDDRASRAGSGPETTEARPRDGEPPSLAEHETARAQQDQPDRQAKSAASAAQSSEDASAQAQPPEAGTETAEHESGEEDSGQGEGQSADTASGQQGGAQAEAAAAAAGGAEAAASGAQGAAASGDEGDDLQGAALRAASEEGQSSSGAASEAPGAAGDEQARSADGDGEQASGLPDGRRAGGADQALAETAAPPQGAARAGQDEPTSEQVRDRAEGEPLAAAQQPLPSPERDQAEQLASSRKDDRAGEAPGAAAEPDAAIAPAARAAQPGAPVTADRPPAPDGGPMAEEDASGPTGERQSSRTVELSQFDQLREVGRTALGEQADAAADAAALDAAPRQGGALSANAVVEAWLDRIDSNPAALLRRRFLLEEQAMPDGGRGALTEPRPW